MATAKPPFTALPFPRMRRMIVDAGRYWRRHNTVYGLVELDISRMRERLRVHKAATGESLSMTAFLVATIARAVDSNRIVHAYRNRRNQLIVFDDVDISVVFEAHEGDVTFPILHIIRAANRRSFREISDEIRRIQKDPARGGSGRVTNIWHRFLGLPQWLRDIVYWFFRRNPPRWKKWGGTVGITSLGSSGKGSGWWMPMCNYTLGFCVGGIVEKPCHVNGELVAHEFLDLTVIFDHDVVDGGPMARFVNRFRELVENAEVMD